MLQEYINYTFTLYRQFLLLYCHMTFSEDDSKATKPVEEVYTNKNIYSLRIEKYCILIMYIYNLSRIFPQ